MEPVLFVYSPWPEPKRDIGTQQWLVLEGEKPVQIPGSEQL